MSRTDVVAPIRPQAAGAAAMRRGSSRALRRLLVLPLALLLAVALVAPTALAASTGKEGLSGYNQTPKSSTGTSPAKEKSTPTKEVAPAKETAPATTTETGKAKTLPFTGFDLRWDVGIGLLIMGAGFSLLTVQRRQRRQSGR